MTLQAYQYAGGYGTVAIPNPPINSPRDPVNGQDIVSPGGNPYQLGQYWRNSVTATVFQFLLGGIWAEVSQGTGGPITTLTPTSGGAQSPTAGNINLLGTANQITAVGSGSTITYSLIGPYTPATYTAHGVLIGEGTSSIVATSAGLAGQVLTSGGASADPTWTTATFPATAGATGTILRSNGTNWVASTDTYPNTVVAGDIIIATATNVVGSLADVATGQVLTSGGVGVAPAYSGSPSVSGSLTAGTTVTATLGNITATNGQLAAPTAGTGLLLNPTVATGIAASPLVCNGRVGAATFSGVSIAAAADLTLTITNSSIGPGGSIVHYSLTGTTTGSALTIKSVTNTAGSSAVVVTNGTGATTSTANITLTFLVLN